MKKILCLDFDGVIHSYTSPWRNARKIPDPPVDYAFRWIREFMVRHCIGEEAGWQVNIFSSRSRYKGGVEAMKKWMLAWGFDAYLLRRIKLGARGDRRRDNYEEKR